MGLKGAIKNQKSTKFVNHSQFFYWILQGIGVFSYYTGQTARGKSGTITLIEFIPISLELTIINPKAY